MKYKNVSDQVKMFKLHGSFVNVQPGEVVDLPRKPSEEDMKEVVEEAPKVEAPKKVRAKPKKKEPKSKEELKEMTKDQLNDYAAKNGLEKVSSRMRKAVMIKAILKHQKKK